MTLPLTPLTFVWTRDKAATALKGVVNVGAVDATVHQKVAQKYGIQGFPTIKVFGADKRSPTDYQVIGRSSSFLLLLLLLLLLLRG